MTQPFNLYQGDCLQVLKELSDNSIDSIVTDPPYGLKFMGKKWDCEVPSIEIWQECIRVLKPGGHLLAFAGTRTQHRMACNIEDAGFEIRDMIAWIYGSGFPKSHNLDGEWQGWGTALKPALEPITFARKPLIGTVAQNVQLHGTGAINIDECRISLMNCGINLRQMDGIFDWTICQLHSCMCKSARYGRTLAY
jgi:site-specific DNA-methyltransferase (adenine-specific)